MGRYLSIPVLGLAAAISASILPQLVAFAVGVTSNFTPFLVNTRGNLSLVMLLVLAWSIRSELGGAFVWALVGGIAIDLFSILPLGTSSAALLIIVYMVNGFSRQLYRMRIIWLLAVTLLATLFFQFFIYVALLILGYRYDIVMLARLVTIPTLIYNLVAILPVYVLVRLLQRRMGTAFHSSRPSLVQESEAGA